MASEQTQRRLAAILSADVVGYSRLMAEDEDATVRTLKAYREQVAALIRQHRGRVVDAPGDNLLAEFATATDAVAAALEIQRVIRARNEAVPDTRRMVFRIGVHLGEARVEGKRLYGDAVNVAARLESLAEPGGICISDDVLRQVQRKLDLAFDDLGPQQVKNIPDPVRVHRVREASASAGSVASRWVSHRAVAAFAGAALVAIAVATYFTFTGRSPTENGAPLTSIAVLPFDDMSPGGDQKWLADGMAEELIETLSRIEALRVPARTSAFALRGKDIATVGKELRVGSVVEGSVRRADDQLRVTAQLIRVADGYHLWSARYDRKLADVFAVQSELARAIAEAIGDEVGLDYDAPVVLGNAHEPSDVRAYERLRKAADAIFPFRTEAGLRKGIELLEEALAIDPEYATARAYLGYCYYWLWVAHGRAQTDLTQARKEVERALAGDETNGVAIAVLGEFLLWENQWEEARRVVERGLAYNPAHNHLRAIHAYALAYLGRHAEAVAEARRAVDLDPRQVIMHMALGAMHLVAREYAAAVEALERAWVLVPGIEPLRTMLSYAYHLDGRDEEALEASVRALPPELEGLGTAIRQGFAGSGFLGAVRAAHEWRVARSGRSCTADAAQGAANLALLGEVDAMFECLDEAMDRSDMIGILTAAYDPYRNDPRFTALLRRMNLAE